MRTSLLKTILHPSQFKLQLLDWAQQYREIIYLDSNEYPQQYSSYDCIVAVDAFTSIKTDYHNAFEDLKVYQETTKDWLFGYLSYDLKNGVEDLVSHNDDGLHFPDLFFFQPKKIFLVKGNQLEIRYLNMCDDEMEFDLKEIENNNSTAFSSTVKREIKQRITKVEYLEKVSKILSYIKKGALYEANFCMEFFAEKTIINPLEIYKKLNSISEPPFAVYLKNNQHYLLSASPERYLRKEGNKVVTQPIKGTAKRHSDLSKEELAITELSSNVKERSENIMIVDLVRNDLSHTAEKGSVQVEELCVVYSFKQVHQMISTVISQVSPMVSPVEIIKTTFPMGSMTGAPKIAAMKIIEEVEETKRGLYSGAVGYFTPTGDFDFNVVIRSILYNEQNQYVSFSVGSAITSESIAEQEYEECLLKAKAMFEVLNSGLVIS